jgi:hypothetical protein
MNHYFAMMECPVPGLFCGEGLIGTTCESRKKWLSVRKIPFRVLSSEKATMQENIASLDKLKGHIKLSTCDNRPCVEVETKSAIFAHPLEMVKISNC